MCHNIFTYYFKQFRGLLLLQINVLDYLEKTAAKYPGKIAIIDEQTN